jgi:hypothetical protein
MEAKSSNRMGQGGGDIRSEHRMRPLLKIHMTTLAKICMFAG